MIFGNWNLVIGNYLELACLPQAGDLVIGILVEAVGSRGNSKVTIRRV